MQKWRKSLRTVGTQSTTTNGHAVTALPATPTSLRIAIVGMGGVTATFRNWPERVIGRALVQRGHRVVNIGYHQPNQEALRERATVVDGITVRRVPVRHWPNHAVYHALDELGPFDVIHLFHPRNVLAYGTTRWAERHHVPTVYTWLGPFHDRYLIDDRERPYEEQPRYDRLLWSFAEALHWTLRDGHLRDHLRNYALHYPLRMAKALLPCSEHEANVMRSMGLEQTSTVVPLWIDVAHVSAMPARVSPGPHPTILFIGQLTPRKGYDLLVRALPEVLKYHPKTTVQVVAGLNEADRLVMEALAAEMGVRDQIIFRGRVDDAELVNLLRAADVYVTPTRYEGFGLTLLEAMAAPCPIVASAIPVVNEIVEHGVSGWLVAPNDVAALAEGIVRVLGDAGLRARLCQGGRAALSSQFDEQALICEIERVYRRVSARPRRYTAKIYDLPG
ncbi:MAG: glycosyltransferase family 4 protein [Herpetosiphonaceae bacterium]|nr:glycosyltransferase family 4 protein [Herpetosiphonaceae bacterium]